MTFRFRSKLLSCHHGLLYH